MVRRFGCKLICLGALFLRIPVFAQSLEDLENEALMGNTLESSTPAPVVEEEIKNSDSSQEDISFTREVKPKEIDEKVYKDVDELLTGPKAIPMKHIFAVKHQYIFLKGRHEIIPFSLGIQPSDSFRKQISMGLSYLYHFTETFAVEALHLNFLTNLSSGFAEDMHQNTGLGVERVEPVISAGASFHWAPFQGKSATAENIYHYEGYLFAGGGYTQFEVGSSGMIMGGVGVRLFTNRRSTLKFEVRDYYDLKEDAGNRLNIVLGAGILLGAPSL